MTVARWVAVYGIALVVFFALDLAWLGLVARDFYQQQLGHLLGPVNWAAAVVFYLVFIIGIVLFAVAPALRAQSTAMALRWGALYGFFTYATYDLTNYSTLRDWPLLVAVVDIGWGALLCALVAGVSCLLARRFVCPD